MLNLLPIIGFGRIEGYIVLFFYIVAILGFILAFQAVKEDKK